MSNRKVGLLRQTQFSFGCFSFTCKFTLEVAWSYMTTGRSLRRVGRALVVNEKELFIIVLPMTCLRFTYGGSRGHAIVVVTGMKPKVVQAQLDDPATATSTDLTTVERREGAANSRTGDGCAGRSIRLAPSLLSTWQLHQRPVNVLDRLPIGLSPVADA